MPGITTAQMVRRALGDPIRRTAQYVIGDGSATAFFLSGAPVYSGTAPAFRLVLAGGLISASGIGTATAWDHENGIVALNSALWAGSAALAEYHWSVFSEVEIEQITASYGTIDEMAIAGIEWLQADYAKRVKWSMAQGPSVDPSNTTRALEALWKQYQEKLRLQTVEGGLESWGEWTQPRGGLWGGWTPTRGGEY